MFQVITVILAWKWCLVIHLQMYQFEKSGVPADADEHIHFIDNLMKFGVSIQQYEKAYAMDDITM